MNAEMKSWFKWFVNSPEFWLKRSVTLKILQLIYTRQVCKRRSVSRHARVWALLLARQHQQPSNQQSPLLPTNLCCLSPKSLDIKELKATIQRRKTCLDCPTKSNISIRLCSDEPLRNKSGVLNNVQLNFPDSRNSVRKRSDADRASGAEETAWPRPASGERTQPSGAAGEPAPSCGCLSQELRGGDIQVGAENSYITEVSLPFCLLSDHRYTPA